MATKLSGPEQEAALVLIQAKAQRLKAARGLQAHGITLQPGDTVEDCCLALAVAIISTQPDFWEAVNRLAAGDHRAIEDLLA